MFDRLDREARVASAMAQELARSVRHRQTSADHLLVALVRGTSVPVATVCEQGGIDPDTIVELVESRMRPGDQAPEGELRLDRSGRQAVELAFREALLLEHDWVGTGHLLVGALEAAGLPFDRDRLRAAVRETRPAPEEQPG